jgi:DNA modification methylase
MYKIYNQENTTLNFEKGTFDLIYADMIYEDENLSWISFFWKMLKENGVFIIQTDWHTDYLVRYYFEKSGNIDNCEFLSHAVWKNEWGNHPKDRYHQCYDDILFYVKGKTHKFYSDRIQVTKATARSKGLNPSGKDTKTATAWIDDICLTTVSKERIKDKNGKCVRWQKPVDLYQRILSPFLDDGDTILDPFGGVFSAGEWCIKNNINYVGCEYDKEIFDLGKERLEQLYD